MVSKTRAAMVSSREAKMPMPSDERITTTLLDERITATLRESDTPLTLNELLAKLEIPRSNMAVRDVIWRLIDRDRVELTAERKLTCRDNGNTPGGAKSVGSKEDDQTSK